jgi:heme-degrading monooxygenase HmoA
MKPETQGDAMAKGYVIAWEFQVKQDGEEKFRAAYGPEGEWAGLFGKAEGFLHTQLARSEFDAHKFITVDVWQSRAAYDAFRKKYALEYDALDTILQELTLHEQKVGGFYWE